MRKSKGKRLLSLLLTLCMVISLVPATAFAAEGDIFWSTTEENTLEIKNGDITEKELYDALLAKADVYGTPNPNVYTSKDYGVTLFGFIKLGTATTDGGYQISYGESSTNINANSGTKKIVLESGELHVIKHASTTETNLSYKGIGYIKTEYSYVDYNGVTRSFTPKFYYNPTVTSDDNTSATVTEKVYYGNKATVAVTVDNGYTAKVTNLSGDEQVLTESGSVEFTVESVEDATFTVTSEIVEVAPGAVALTVGNGGKVEGVDAGTYEAGKTFTFTATPDAGYYVDSIKIDDVEKVDSATFNSANRSFTTSFTVESEKTHTVNVVFTEKTLTVNDAEIGFNPKKSVADQIDILKAEIFADVVANSVPAGIELGDVTIEYKANNEYPNIADVPYVWSALNVVPDPEKHTLGNYDYYAFAKDGIGSTETIRLTWGAEGKYPEVIKEVTITLVESRPEATIEVGTPAKVTLGETDDDNQAVIDAVKAVTTEPDGVDYEYALREAFTAPQPGSTGEAWVVITAPETVDNVLTTKEVKVTIETKVTPATINVKTADYGTVTVNGWAEGTTNTSAAATLQVVATPDAGYYVADVKVNGVSIVNGNEFAERVFTDNMTVENEKTYEVEATFAKREVVLKAAPYTVAYNKHFEPKDVVDDIEKTIKAVVIDDSTLGYNADATTVKVYVDKLGYQEMGLLANLYFNDATETVQLILPATDRYPEVIVEGINIKVVDSRKEADIEFGTPAVVTLGTANDEQAIKDAVLDATTVNTAGVSVTADNLTVATYDAPDAGKTAEVTVTITVPASEYSLATTKTTTVTVKSKDQPASITVANADNGTVTVGNVAEGATGTAVAGDLVITATPDAGYYVDTITVTNGSVTNEVYDGANYTSTLTVANNNSYTVTVTFAKRVTLNAADAEGRYTIAYNMGNGADKEKANIEEAIKNAVIDTTKTMGYDAAKTSVTVKVLDKDYLYLPISSAYFNDAVETVKLTLEAEGKYPKVEIEAVVKVTDSREKLDITAATEFEAASPTTAKEVLEAEVLKAANLPEGVEIETIAYDKEITELPAVVTATITTKGNATYQPGKAVVTVTVNQKITTADLTVAVNGEGTVNGETNTTFAIDPGNFALNVKPAAGWYVDYIVVDGNTITRGDMTPGADYAFSYTLANVAAGEDHSVTAYFMKPEIAVANKTATMNYNAFVADVNAQIVKTVPYTVKPEGKVPAGELKIYYQARTAGTLTTELWLEVGTDLNKLEYAGAHAFGKTVLGATSETESVRYEYVLADGFKVTSDVITLSLTDERAVTEIRLNPEAVEVTYGQFTADQLKAALLDGVYAGESKIEGAEVTFEKDPTKLNAGDEVEVTLKYAGTAEYQDSTVTTKIKINKAPVTVTVNSAMVKYGTSYGDLVTTDPADVKTIDLIIGLDAASLQLDGEGSVTGVETVINMRLPDRIQSAFDKIGLTNGADMTLTQAIGLLENGKGLMATLGVSEETVDMLVTSMKSLRDQIGEVRIAVGAPLPTNIGAYLVAGIAADENYQTAIDVGYLAITPNGQRAYLDWKIHDENGAVALPAIQSGSYDLSAYVTEVAEGSVEEATKELEHIFFGVDKDGNILLTQDQKDLDLGAYTELAFILNWGNEMYYAEPIARAFVVVPKYIPVTFVDENGNVNPDRSFTYDGKEHGMKAVVEGVAEPGANLTVTYRGVQTDGTVYESTIPPVNAGAYAVTAIYVEKDANGTITGMGFALGAMKINLSGDATIKVEDFVQKTYDGEGYDISSMITSAPDDAARLIITSSIDTTGDVSVNGLEGIGNNVNMDFPDRVDKVLSGIDFFKPAYNGEGLTVNNFVDWIKANEAVFTGMNLDAAKVSALTDLLAKLPDNTKVKFDEIETVSPSSVGAYVVVGLILDPNYKPIADTGMLVIVPAAEQVTLKYEEDFNGNNIFTPEALKYIDLDAAAYNEDDTLNAEATALVQNVYAGIDAQGNEVLTTDWTTLKTGVYTEYSYLLAMGNKTYYAVPVSRTFIIAPDVITVKFVDGNDDPNYIRKFTYDGTPHAMEAVATNASGNVVTDGDMIVKYIGISGDGEGYNSTTAPTKAGVYTVTATYVEKNEDGSVAAAGFAAGAMAIEKAESTFDIADTTVTYDGEGHFVTVTNNENAKYVALIANRADKTVNVQIPEEFDAIVAELPESVDVKELKDVLNKAINKVFGYVGENVTMPENFQTKLDALLTEVETLMAEVPNVTVTFNEENPVNAGTYEVYVVTYAANHNSTYDKANLEITKRPVTITADDQEVIVGNAEPEYTYSVTEGSIVEGDELVITVDCPSYEDVVGTYEIVATCEAHANYEVTAVNGTLTVTEKPVVPVTGVTLNSTTAALEIGETTTLTATVEPADASVQGVTWTSSDESVATVDENGVVTAVGEGEAIITATTVDGAYTADCTVTVTAAAVTGYTVSGNVTSYLEETDTVTIQLISEGSEEAAYETTMVGNTGTYSMEGVAAGTYTLKAFKAGHVISEYAIDVNGDVVQDVVLAILGDVTLDLKVNMDDVVALLRHVVKAEIINEPASLAAGEVTYDDNLNMDDVVKLLRFVVKAIGSLE